MIKKVCVKIDKDRIYWEHAGFECQVYRHDTIGHLCGYVKIPKGHTLYGMSMPDIKYNYDIDVHGSVTYSETYKGAWIIGFDCAHSGDKVFSATYFKECKLWTIEDTMKETNRLAEQLLVENLVMKKLRGKVNEE